MVTKSQWRTAMFLLFMTWVVVWCSARADAVLLGITAERLIHDSVTEGINYAISQHTLRKIRGCRTSVLHRWLRYAVTVRDFRNGRTR